MISIIVYVYVSDCKFDMHSKQFLEFLCIMHLILRPAVSFFSWRECNGRFCPTPKQTNFYYAVCSCHWSYWYSSNSTCRLSYNAVIFLWCLAYVESISESLKCLNAIPLLWFDLLGLTDVSFWYAPIYSVMCCSLGQSLCLI